MTTKIITCDLDETLIPPSLEIGGRVIEDIRAATAAGHKFVVATGRGYATVQGTLAQIGLAQAPGQYVISYNGAILSENLGNRVRFFKGLEHEQAEALFHRALGYDVCTHVYTEDTVWVRNLNEREAAYMRGRQDWEEFDDTSLDFLKGQRIAKILFENEDEAYRLQMERDFADLSGDCSVSYSSERYIEFNRKGIDKGFGLVELARELGVDRADTIAIGDNFNDLSMIEAAGTGCGVANVNPGVVPSCDYVCQDKWDEGVAEVLERFVLA
jgi:Cof subfamily protein (haloacid dehalogenase superfamily)